MPLLETLKPENGARNARTVDINPSGKSNYSESLQRGAASILVIVRAELRREGAWSA